MTGNGMEAVVQCGRRFSEREIEQICETVELFPGLALTELTATICEHLGWHTAGGRPKGAACAKLLVKLDDRGAARRAISDAQELIERGARIPEAEAAEMKAFFETLW